MDLLQLFPNLGEYLQLIPVGLVSILVGIVSYFNTDTGGSLKLAIRAVITSALIVLITYSILMATDLPYLAKVGISAALGYFGIDKAIEMAQKLIAMKNGNPNAGAKNEK